MKSLYYLIIITFLSLLSCQNNVNKETENRLLSENNRLIRELAKEKEEKETLKKSLDSIENVNEELTLAKDTLQSNLKKQAEKESLRLKALNTPIEMSTFAVVNEGTNKKVLKNKSPFKKSEVRYLSFQGTATNNMVKNKQILRGRLYAIYRLGGLVQRMDNTSGTFTGNDKKKYVYTHSWELQSEKESFYLNKGIGDKSRGIFEKGRWNLELWFEPQNKGFASKVGDEKFEIN